MDDKYHILNDGILTGAFFKKTTNCKINVFQNFNCLIGCIKSENPNISMEEFKTIFIEILKKCNITVLFDITENHLVPYLLDNFEYYYAIQIPIGYGKDPTTMICLKNIYSNNVGHHKYLLDKSLISSL